MSYTLKKKKYEIAKLIKITYKSNIKLSFNGKILLKITNIAW